MGEGTHHGVGQVDTPPQSGKKLKGEKSFGDSRFLGAPRVMYNKEKLSHAEGNPTKIPRPSERGGEAEVSLRRARVRCSKSKK